MSDHADIGDRKDPGPEARQILQVLQDQGYKVYVAQGANLVVCTATNPRLNRSAVGTDDRGNVHMAMSSLVRTLRIDLPGGLQPVPGGRHSVAP